MFFTFLLLFTVLPALELAVLIEVGSRIGAANTILLILLSGVAGAALARIQGFAILRQIQGQLNQGLMPTEAMLDGILILVGGIVLLTPGFITDTLGLLCLIPWSRAILKRWLKHAFHRNLDRGDVMTIRRSSMYKDDDIEDADFH